MRQLRAVDGLAGEGERLRLYVPGTDEFATDGYPLAWATGTPAIKDLIRERAGHRCVRCGHPYRVRTGMGEWSPCDIACSHFGPYRLLRGDDTWQLFGDDADEPGRLIHGNAELTIEARYRILTVHHLDGDKANCRWWNLAALCQRCHLEIQGRVVMDRVWPHEHSLWFRPYVAGYYAWRYLGQELTRAEAEARLDELLALEVRQLSLAAPSPSKAHSSTAGSSR